MNQKSGFPPRVVQKTVERTMLSKNCSRKLHQIIPKTKTGYKIWNKKVLPIRTYESEMWTSTEDHIKRMRIVQKNVERARNGVKAYQEKNCPKNRSCYKSLKLKVSDSSLPIRTYRSKLSTLTGAYIWLK